ncbi:MAG: pilus assembly protein [Anaerostipes sp.]|nr:pilus assembly protein [Anaerostipes sp.]
MLYYANRFSKPINRINQSKNIKNSRASFFASCRGSASVETALVLPIFIFVFLMLMLVGEVLYTHGNRYKDLSETAKEMAVNKGISIRKHSGYIFTMVKNGKEEYSLTSYYKIELKLPFLNPFLGVYTQKIKQKAMTGYVPTGDELKEGYVYVTPHESVYHKDINCTHLALSISADSDVEKYLKGKTHYKVCEHCTKYHKGSVSQVYIGKEGDAYHTDIDCSGLKRTVSQVELSTLKGVKPCQRCGK